MQAGRKSGILLRYFQYLLLLIGPPILWALIVGFGMAVLGDVIVFRPPPGTHGTGAWGSAYGVILFLFLGGIFGLIGGLVQAITQIVQSDGQTWKLPTWLGIAAGVCLCIILQFNAITSDSSGLFKDLFVDISWGAAALIVAMGTLGGWTGKLISIAYILLSRGAQKKPHSQRNR